MCYMKLVICLTAYEEKKRNTAITLFVVALRKISSALVRHSWKED